MLREDRKTASCAGNMVSMSEETSDTDSVEQSKSLANRIPCFGILLIITAVTVFQAGSVVAKKMSLHPLMMLLYRLVS